MADQRADTKALRRAVHWAPKWAVPRAERMVRLLVATSAAHSVEMKAALMAVRTARNLAVRRVVRSAESWAGQ